MRWLWNKGFGHRRQLRLKERQENVIALVSESHNTVRKVADQVIAIRVAADKIEAILEDIAEKERLQNGNSGR